MWVTDSRLYHTASRSAAPNLTGSKTQGLLCVPRASQVRCRRAVFVMLGQSTEPPCQRQGHVGKTRDLNSVRQPGMRRKLSRPRRIQRVFRFSLFGFSEVFLYFRAHESEWWLGPEARARRYLLTSFDIS